MAASRVAVFLDYQNVHLMAHGLFMPYGTPVQDALVHPLRVAECLVAKRRDDSELSSVRVFRGRPNPGRQPIPAAANDAQTAAWEREDPRLRVIRRDLNYRGWPEHPPREKGVDVALAIALVESALLNEPAEQGSNSSAKSSSSQPRRAPGAVSYSRSKSPLGAVHCGVITFAAIRRRGQAKPAVGCCPLLPSAVQTPPFRPEGSTVVRSIRGE